MSNLGRRELCEGGGNYLKYLKMGWKGKEGRETKILKRGASWVKRCVSQKGRGVGVGGGWNPLMNYGLD